MTEIEIMQRAKEYIDKLADGINPLDNSSVPENDIVREKRIATCFQYISRFLEKDIRNAQEQQFSGEKRFYVSEESFPRPKLQTDIPQISKQEVTVPENKFIDSRSLFYLSEEQKTNLHPFADEAKITELTKYLNSLIDRKQFRPLRDGMISKWLASYRFLQLIPSINKYKPTSEGEKIGILCRLHTWNGFEAPRCIYTRAAQQYIFDNIDSLIEFNMLEN